MDKILKASESMKYAENQGISHSQHIWRQKGGMVTDVPEEVRKTPIMTNPVTKKPKHFSESKSIRAKGL